MIGGDLGLRDSTLQNKLPSLIVKTSVACAINCKIVDLVNHDYIQIKVVVL